MGKQLVEALRSAQEPDTLTRWMAHYVAEQITVAESTTGVKKATAEERCYATILALWAHRNKLPNGLQPFEGFEPILQALARLDPDEPRSYFLNAVRRQAAGEQEPDEVERLLRMIDRIDRAARIVIDLCLQAAAAKASTPATQAYLTEAIDSSPAGDIDALRRLTRRGAESPHAAEAAAVEQLERRIAALDGLVAMSRRVRPEFAAKLKKARRELARLKRQPAPAAPVPPGA